MGIYPSADNRPLTRGEETALLLACLLLTPLVAVFAYFWWSDRAPQKARSVVELTLTCLRVVAVVALLVIGLSILSGLLNR